MNVLRTILALLAVPVLGLAAAPPGVTSITITPTPAVVGSSVLFQGVASSSGGVLTYRWFFGDGNNSGAPSALNVNFSHTYAAPGHYTVTFEVTETGGGSPGVTTDTRPLTVHQPLTANAPTNSSTIILDSANTNLWVVNPDQDSVTCIDIGGGAFTRLGEFPVGQAPRTLAQCSVDGRIWVVSQQHPSISILAPTSPFTLEHVIPLPHGSLPYGIAMSTNGAFAYVTLQGSGGVKKISTSTRQIVASSTTPASARGVSVKSNGNVLVTRFISPQSDPLINFDSLTFKNENHGEVVELNANLGVVRTFNLAIDPGPFPSDADPDFGPSGVPPSAMGSRGIPNYLTSLVITPDGLRAWVPSKKDNIQRGKKTPERDGKDPGPEVTYRAILSSLDLVGNTEKLTERVDIDNSEMPQAACVSPLGDYIFIALQGTNRVQVRDLYNMGTPLNSTGDATGTSATNGLAPQGIVYDPATNCIYVQNYMARTVSKMDAAPIFAGNGAAANLGAPTVLATFVTADKLTGLILPGKQVFYNSGDTRMSSNGYISCAGCHLDGGSDARVFDFTNRGEGFRNTVMLQGRGGVGHGNVHWSANFNEIQDFENDIQNAFGGTGFSGGAPNAPLGTANAGRPSAGAELDQLAAYVASLTKVSRSPFRNSNGTLTATGAAGEAIFKTMDCQRCHGGRNFSDSTVGTLPAAIDPLTPPAPNTPILHNIGTVKASSGQRLNSGPLPGVDTPTLKGVWQTAPYLHNGSAATLDAVFSDATVTAHFVLNGTQRAQLAQYMREIDEIDAPPVPVQTNTVTITSVSTGRPYSLADSEVNGFPFVDRSYQIKGGGTLTAAGMKLVRTAEDDKLLASTSHLTLTFGAGATWRVYVCYDPRASTLPTWLTTNFGPSAAVISITNITNNLVVRQTDVLAPGTLTLGGNLAAGAAGAMRNYFVVIEKLTGSHVVEEGPLNKNEWVHDQDADGDGLLDEYEAVNTLSPWIANTGGALPTDQPSDEDKIVTGTTTRFQDQGPIGGGGGGGGGGGCGLSGFEFLLPLALFRLVRRRRQA